MLKDEFTDSAYSTFFLENWNSWDDYIAHYRMDAPDWIPCGSTSTTHSYLDRPGFKEYDE